MVGYPGQYITKFWKALSYYVRLQCGTMSTITVSGRSIDTKNGLSIEENIRNAGMLPDAYLYLMDGRPIPMDTKVEDSMQIRAVKVASGG